MAVLAVEQILEGIQAVVGPRGARVEGALVIVEVGLEGGGRVAVAMAREVRRVRAGALDVGVGRHGSHVGRGSDWLMTVMASRYGLDLFTVCSRDAKRVRERTSSRQSLMGSS